MNLYIIILSGLKRETVSYSLRKRMSFLFITDNAHGNIKFDNTIYQRIHFSLNILKKYFVTYIRHIAKIWCKFLHTLDVWHLNNAKWICIHKFKYNQFTTCMKKKKCLLTTNICTNVFDTEAVQASVTSDMSPFFTNYWITLEFWYWVKA